MRTEYAAALAAEYTFIVCPPDFERNLRCMLGFVPVSEYGPYVSPLKNEIGALGEVRYLRQENADMTAQDAKLVDIAAQLLHETSAALLLHDGDKKVWVPKSLVEENGDGTFTMPEWLAQDKELI